MKRYKRLFEDVGFILNKKSDTNNYVITKSLNQIDKWKAKIILANNGGKKGKIDKVGYVAINLKTNEIIPIARSDEHQQGYELLHYFKKKGIITNVTDWLNVFKNSNYIDSEKEIPDWLIVCKKWIKYGGSKDTILNSNGYNGMPTWKATFEEFLQYKGKPPTTTKGTNKIKEKGKEIISLIEILARLINQYRKNMRDNPKIYQYASKILLWDKKLGLESPWFNLIYNLGNWSEDKKFLEEGLEKIKKASNTDNIQMVEEVIFGMNGFKNLLHRGLKKFLVDYDNLDERKIIAVESIFGDVELAVEEFNRLGSI